MIKNASQAWKEKILSQNVNLSGLKMTGWITYAKNVKKKPKKQKKQSAKSKNQAIKIFPIMYPFCSGDLNKCFCC